MCNLVEEFKTDSSVNAYMYSNIPRELDTCDLRVKREERNLRDHYKPDSIS